MGRFKLQLFLEENTCSTRYVIPDRHSDSSTQWTLVYSNFNMENFGNNLIYDQTHKPHADLSHSILSITHSSY